MRHRFNYQLLQISLFILLCIACSKDKGNYNYRQINRLIAIDQDSTEINGKNYIAQLGLPFQIRIQITGSLNEIDDNDLNFYWIINSDTVSRKKILDIDTKDLGPGQYPGKLMIVDRHTALSYNYAFTLLINTILYQSIILTENEQKETIIVSRPTTLPVYLPLLQFGGIKPGKNPVNIDVNYLKINNGKDRLYQTLILTTQDGQYPLMELNYNAIFTQPLFTFPAKGGIISGQLLKPSFSAIYKQDLFNYYRFEGIILVDGKCHAVSNGVISGDVYRTDPLDYDFGEDGVALSRRFDGFVLAGFDKKNERIRVFANNGAGGGIYTENFDNLIPPSLTKGHRFVAAVDVIDSLQLNVGKWKWQFLTRRDSQVFLFDLLQEGHLLSKVQQVASKSVPEIVDGINFRYHAGYWYFAKGRTIYRFASNGLDISPYVTLPAGDTGDITTWNFYIDNSSTIKKIGIATYNPISPQALKGAYYLFDLPTQKFELQDTSAFAKAIDIELCF